MFCWTHKHCGGVQLTSMFIFMTLLKEVDSRYRPCLNNTEKLCEHQPEDSWKVSSEVWEAFVLVIGILLFVFCGGAVILRWICDFMHKFKSSQNRYNTRRQPRTPLHSSPPQSWYPSELPPPYYGEAPGYDEVILTDILNSTLPPEPPPYCFEPPTAFEPADADEHDAVTVQRSTDGYDEPVNISRNVSIISESFEVTEASMREANGIPDALHSGLQLENVSSFFIIKP